MNIRNIFALLLSVLLLLSVAGCCPPSNILDSSSTDNSSTGNEAPSFSLELLDNTEFKLEDHQGKPVLINFWATWCPPCREEIPALIAVYEKYKDEVQFIAIAVSSDKENDVREFVANNSVSYPVGMDTSGEIAKSYEVSGIPATFFINKDGTIKDSHAGAMNENQFSEKIEELLK